jgi:hypothetical protein
MIVVCWNYASLCAGSTRPRSHTCAPRGVVCGLRISIYTAAGASQPERRAEWSPWATLVENTPIQGNPQPSVAAFLVVAYTSLLGMAFVGLVICYVSTQLELDVDRPVGSSLATSLVGGQLRAERDMAVEPLDTPRITFSSLPRCRPASTICCPRYGGTFAPRAAASGGRCRRRCGWLLPPDGA